MSRVAAPGLLVLGLLQMLGDVLGIAPLQGLAAATAASPAPKVFSTVQGLETYSTKFFVEWSDLSGKEHSLQLTPEVYSQLEGTYNRRNTYGAAVAYAPIFAGSERTQKMLISIGRYALCGDAPLLRDLDRRRVVPKRFVVPTETVCVAMPQGVTGSDVSVAKRNRVGSRVRLGCRVLTKCLQQRHGQFEPDLRRCFERDHGALQAAYQRLH